MFQVRLEKVARPLTSVDTTLVDPAVRVPLEVRVTETPESATGFPLVSSTWTVGAGDITLPAVVVDGPCTNPSFLATPAVTAIEPVVAVSKPATGSV